MKTQITVVRCDICNRIILTDVEQYITINEIDYCNECYTLSRSGFSDNPR